MEWDPERKRAEILVWWEAYVEGRLRDARELHHDIWMGDKMVVARDAGTWLEAKGSKLAVRRTWGRRVGTGSFTLLSRLCGRKEITKVRGWQVGAGKQLWDSQGFWISGVESERQIQTADSQPHTSVVLEAVMVSILFLLLLDILGRTEKAYTGGYRSLFNRLPAKAWLFFPL